MSSDFDRKKPGGSSGGRTDARREGGFHKDGGPAKRGSGFHKDGERRQTGARPERRVETRGGDQKDGCYRKADARFEKRADTGAGFHNDGSLRKDDVRPEKRVETRGGTDYRGDGAARWNGGMGRRFGDDRRGASGNARRAADRRPQKSARDVALKALQDVVRSDAYAAQALDRQMESARLSPEDRRLAASLFYFAVENRLYIEYILARRMDAKPDPVVNDILHIAAAQLLFMDRVPDHAAVDEAVKQARASGREGLSGLVNGVLRGLIRARDAGELVLPDRDASSEEWLSVKYSLSRPVARRLIEAYGLEEAERIAAWTPSRREQTVRPNRARMDGAAFETWLDAQQYHWRRGIVDDSYVIEDGGSLAASEGYRRGLFSIQGQSAMLAAQAVGARPGMQILDACAAPGGKTCLMAERMGGAGRVYAWDVHEHRVQLIYAAARRLGLDNVRPIQRDARRGAEGMALSMDAVLVDAPCSGLGVIAEKPDIKYRQSDEAMDALPPLQAQILESCAQAVKVGGLLVYATCTILPAENGAIVDAFLERHPEFAVEVDAGWLPEALRPRFEDGRVQILPQRDGMEGFFIARLRRKGV